MSHVRVLTSTSPHYVQYRELILNLNPGIRYNRCHGGNAQQADH